MVTQQVRDIKRTTVAEEDKDFWTSILGILTGAATLLATIASTYIAIWGGGKSRPDEKLQPAPSVSAVENTPANLRPAKRGGQGHEDVFALTAVIDDPDGYTNVRSMKSASGAIVAQVTEGEQFYTYPQKGDWWQIKTRDGRLGYMYSSRIKLVPGK